MDDSIRVRSGDLNGRAEMPKLGYAHIRNDGKKAGSEIGYHEGEEALYVGTKNGNKRLCGANDVTTLEAKISALEGQISTITARLDALTPSE